MDFSIQENRKATMPDLKDLLTKIKFDRSKFGYDTPAGAAGDCLENFCAVVAHDLGYTVDQDLKEFLLLCDGIDNNGYIIYSSGCDKNSKVENFIQANILWRQDEDKRQYVFFAESGDSLFCKNNDKKVLMLDRYSLDIYMEYKDINKMLCDILTKMLTE